MWLPDFCGACFALPGRNCLKQETSHEKCDLSGLVPVRRHSAETAEMITFATTRQLPVHPAPAPVGPKPSCDAEEDHPDHDSQFRKFRPAPLT
jgi:hypothetical protein